MKHPPPRRLATEALVSTPWLGVDRHRLDDGRELYTLRLADWANVVARTDAGELVFVRQVRQATQRESLEIPGGIIDPGEDPLAAARRELREETGYVAERWRSMGWAHPNPALQDNRVHMFVAEGARCVGDQQLDEGEDLSVELVPEGELRTRMQRGEIHHALVVLALSRFLLGE